MKSIRRLNNVTIDQHLSIFNQPLQTRPTPAFDLRCQKGVEAFARFCLGYKECQGKILIKPANPRLVFNQNDNLKVEL